MLVFLCLIYFTYYNNFRSIMARFYDRIIFHVWMYHSFLILSSHEGHLGHFLWW